VNVTVLVGNPKPASRTLEAVSAVATAIAGGVTSTIDLATLGPKLLDWADADVAAAIATCAASDLLVVGSPTYKGSYTGLLKLFLDRIDGGTGLAGVTTVPVMLSGNPAHALAPELLLKPVLVELGAIVPVQGLSLSERDYAEPGAFDPWLERWRPTFDRRSSGAQTAASSRSPASARTERLTADTIALRDAVEMSPSIPTPQRRLPSTCSST